MTNKVKIIIGIAVFVIIIAGAVIAYDALSERVQPDTGLTVNTDTSPSQSSSDESGDLDTSSQPEETEPEKMKAPDFTVWDASGNSVSLSDMEGTPVILNFWASWCPPCKAEMPEFDAVYAELGDNVTFMMVDLTDGKRETQKDGENYIAEQGFTFPVYFDLEQEAAYTYGIRSIPTTFVIDKDGYLVTGAQGQINEDTLWYFISLVWDAEADESSSPAD